MGIRHHIEFTHCDKQQMGYFAPTCGFFASRCEVCKKWIDMGSDSETFLKIISEETYGIMLASNGFLVEK